MKKQFFFLVLIFSSLFLKSQEIDAPSTTAGRNSANVLKQHQVSQTIDTIHTSDSGILSIDFEKPVTFLLFNFTGKKIYEKKMFYGKMEYDVSHLPSGIYFIVYSDGKKAVMQQILIMKQPHE